MNARQLFVCSALLLLLVNGADAGGTYQRTKDGKTLVWNNHPGPNDAATWSAGRDRAGRAVGYGTLTWYTVKQVFVIGSNIPSPKYIAISRYSGNMVRGKWDGQVVTVGANGRRFHATFVHGRKASNWTDRPAPIAKQLHNERPHSDAVVEAPAEGPARGPTQQVNQPVSQPAAGEAPRRDMDDSLRSLIGPPSLLRANRVAEASPQASVASATSSPPALGHLTAAKVIELAGAEARAQGYDLAEYQRPQAQYAAADNIWSVSYDRKNGAKGSDEAGKRFSVRVDDKTEKASIALKR